MTDRQLLRGQINLLYDLYQQALYPVVRHIENGHDVTYLFDRVYTMPRYAATAEEIAQASAHPDDGEVAVEDVHDDEADEANIDDDMREFVATLRREWRRVKGCDCPVKLYRSRHELLMAFRISQFAAFRKREVVRLDLKDEREKLLEAINAPDGNLPVLCFETRHRVRRTDLDPIREVKLSPTEFHLLQFIYDNGQVTTQELTDEFRSFRNQGNARREMSSLKIEKNRDTHFTNIRDKLKKKELGFTIETEDKVCFIMCED